MDSTTGYNAAVPAAKRPPPKRPTPRRGQRAEAPKPAPKRPADPVDEAIAQAHAAGHDRLAAAIVDARWLLSELLLVRPSMRDTLAALEANAAIDAAETIGKRMRGEVPERERTHERTARALLHLSFARAEFDRSGDIEATSDRWFKHHEGSDLGASKASWRLAIETFPGVPEAWIWSAAPAFNGKPIPSHREREKAITWDQVVYRLLHDIATDRNVVVEAKQMRDAFNRHLKEAQRRTRNRD